MAEPTQVQLMNYSSAAMDVYERVKGRVYAPTDKQIHELIAACGVYVALKRIETNRDIVDELEQEESE
jgi:hypothetical protein